VLERSGACHVRLGVHALTVVDGRRLGGTFDAAYHLLSEQGWELQMALGGGAGLPDPQRVADAGPWTEVPVTGESTT
jgi:hypothetical protein